MSYDEAIKLYPVSPASFGKRIPSPIEDPWIAAGLRRAVAKYQPHKVGVIIAGGFLENLDFKESAAFDLAERMDGLVIWIPREASYPPPIPYGLREPVSFDFTNVTKFTQLHALLKEGLINGTEIQLVRKVYAIGCEVERDVYEGKEYRGEVWETKWITVPLTDSERFPGQPKKHKSRRKK